MISKILNILKANLFTVISWTATALIVAGMLGVTLWWTQSAATAQAIRPEPTAEPNQASPAIALPAPVSSSAFQAIVRQIQLKTNIPERPRYNMTKYTVGRGDTVFGIAKANNIKPESLLFANYDTLEDDPHSLKPGQELNIPPVDGIYYEWQEGDTVEAVATKYEAKPEEIINWPGNSIDLSDPTIKPGTWVMVPGGQREFKQWKIPTVARGSSSGTAETSSSVCGGGPVGTGFVWPTDIHSISGNDFWSGHQGIDITATEGSPVYATASGVVTMAQGGWNYGYGNVIQIDHGNTYSSLYAHLSVIYVQVCDPVNAGEAIGLAGSTGNSTGAHLHFEIRQGGENIDPWFVLQ